MILRWTTLLWLVSFAVAVGLVFQIKYAVQHLEDQLAYAQARIHNDREALHVLRAEWSYLNQPQRIARLAKRHLEMIPLTAPQIGQIASLPPRPEDMDGRVFAEGPPMPPRHPGDPAGLWDTPLPQPNGNTIDQAPVDQVPVDQAPVDERLANGRPADTPDSIGELVAATLRPATPPTSSTSTPAPLAPSAQTPTIRKVPEPLATDLNRLEGDVPRNPVTGAPLPVGHRTLLETR